MRPLIRIHALLLAAAWMLFAVGAAAAQTASRTNKAGAPDAASIARGWTLLASGDHAAASKLSTQLLSRNPRSAAVLALAIEVEIARGGALAGLDAYERWLGTRTVEDAYAVRRVAGALLREIASRDADRATRFDAVQALIADGETDAAALLPPLDAAAPVEAALRASVDGNASVDALIAQASRPGPARRVAVVALGRSRSPRAAPALMNALSDPDPVVRAASAEALGTLKASTAIQQLKPLLDDPVVTVRLAAAGSLLSLNDSSGMPLLRQLQGSEHAAVRLAAARAAASAPNSEWLGVVRELTKDSDPDVRRQAAELIALYDPVLAKTTLEPLLADANPAERQAAADTYAHVTSDYAVLRRFLRDADHGTRVRTADRILELTR
jgi:ParB family chromosome partitioning protein